MSSYVKAALLVVATATALAGGSQTAGSTTISDSLRVTGQMTVARAAHSATLLRSGRVLIAGGCTLPGCDDVEGQTASAELYDPKTHRFARTGSMRGIRVSAMATRLPDGRVLVAGGYSGEKATATTELYDESTGTFEQGPSLTVPRGDATVTRLGDGRILYAGGFSTSGVVASAEIFDPGTMRFSATGSMTIARAVHTATLLADGRVLIVGGSTRGGRVLKTAEVYDPHTGRFTSTGSLSQIRYKHAASLLANGSVLIVGGAPAFDLGLRYRQTEIYDPKSRRFRAGPSLYWGRYHLAGAVLGLRSGKVLVAGDAPDLELYEPRSGRVRRVGELGVSLGFSTAVLLADGSALIAGGYTSVGENPSRQAWLYR